MQYEKFLRLTIFENRLDGRKTYAKLDYVYVNENGVRDKDFTIHHKRIDNYKFDGEESELDRTIDEFARQTNMTEYQLKKNGLVVNLDYHRAKSFERKNKIMDAVAIKPNQNKINNYHVRRTPKKTIVSNLKVRYQNVGKIFSDGVTLLAVASALFTAGKVYATLTETPKNELISFHKVSDQVDKTSEKVINGRVHAESIIGRLVKGKYHEISTNDINFLEQYYTCLGQANNDEDANFFEHSLYNFLEKGLNKSEKYIYGRLETLINGMYVNEGGGNRYHFDSDNTVKYAVYGMSLVVGGEDKLAYESDIKSKYVASTAEGNIFYQMRPEYRLPILINLRETLRTRDIDLTNLPYRVYKIGSYDFNKDDFIRKLDDEILLAKTQLESMCDVKTKGHR